MHRRQFLLSVTALVLRRQGPQATVTDFDDGWLMEIGCVHCAVEQTGGGWTVTLDVYEKQQWWDGRLDVGRMVPTEALRQQLQALGLDLELRGHPTYPSLVGRVDHRLDPDALGRLLAAVLDGGHWGLFYMPGNEGGMSNSPGPDV